MPRLSIIVPHRDNDARLEMTLLSVLENRPQDCEIIVVHDGSYANPYELQDEVIFIEEVRRANTAQLLNAGAMAACSPAVCVILDGTLVKAGWSDSALDLLLNSDSAAVSVGVQYHKSKHCSYGIDSRILRRDQAARSGKLEATREQDTCSGPVLACGFYRRKVLLALGGWNEALDETLIDVELALALRGLGLECRSAPTRNVSTNLTGLLPRKLSSTALSQLSSLFVAHGAVGPGWIPALKSFVSECSKGRFITAAAWSTGLRDAGIIRKTQLRLSHAKQQLRSSADSPALRVYNGQQKSTTASRRRAA